MFDEREDVASPDETSPAPGTRRSLPILESGLQPADAPAMASFRRYLPRAGHPDWPRLDREATAIAEHVRPGLARPRRARDRRRRLAAFATAARNYVINRRLDAQGREDFLPLYFIWTLLRACNFSCDYCDDHRGRRYPELPQRGALETAQAKRLLEIMRTGTPSVYFAGGEPTLRKDLPELARFANEANYYPIIVNTNGSIIDRRLRHARWRTWLADTDIIVVSLDALDLGVLSRMWKSRNPDAVIRNLLLLRALAREQGFRLMVNTVIQPGLVSHARDVLDLANDLGIVFCPVPVNRGPRVDRRLLDDPAYASLVETILERKRAGLPIAGSLRMNERLLRGAPLNCRNTLKPHVDYDGTLLWPCKASVNVEPIRLDVLAHDDLNSLYAEGRARRDPTGFHGDGPDQCGADCNWAQNYSTDSYAHGLRHPAKLLADMLGFLERR